MGLNEYLFILFYMAIPGVVGAVLAHKQGKNAFLWGLLSFLLPFFIFILWYNGRKKQY
ncbi:MAG: hypothetical protein RBQ99_09540 [Trichlorobacter sp.]|nr:hypothetical protein [Trichlorobacter sp.]